MGGAFGWNHESVFFPRGHVSGFSYMEGQANNSGPAAKRCMERQAKLRKTACLGIKDKETRLYITQKLGLDFIQTYTSRRVAVLCIFLYTKLLLSRLKTKCHSRIPSSNSQSLLDCKTARDKNSEPCQQILLGFQNERCQHDSCWTRTTLTGVSMKSPQCTNSKGYFE